MFKELLEGTMTETKSPRKRRRRRRRPRPHVIYLPTPLLLLGDCGPLVVGVMSDAAPHVAREWLWEF